MKPEFIQYLEDNFYVDFRYTDRDSYILDADGNIIELQIGWDTQNPIKPDPKNITDLSIFLPLSPYLEVLHIRNCDLDADMSPIQAFRHLRHLSLCYTNNIHKIAGLDHLTNLESLDLSGNLIEKIEGLESLTKLSFLDLSSNGLGTEGTLKKVEGLGTLTNLETLFLDSNEIEAIEGMDSLTKLKTLTLGNELSQFPDLSALISLEKLRITGCFRRVEGLDGLKNLHTIWVESDHEIENREALLSNERLINITIDDEDIRGNTSGIYQHWWDR